MQKSVTPQIIAELAPTGTLRAALNMANFLLVTGESNAGLQTGVSPDVATEIGRLLKVPVSFVLYETAGKAADAAPENVWDIANIGAEPERAEQIAFTAAYCEIEATFMVPAESHIRSIAEVDQVGNRISVMGEAAYGLKLRSLIQHASIVSSDSIQGSVDAFAEERLEVLAALRPTLLKEKPRLPDVRILDGNFHAVQQAIGTHRCNTAGAMWLAEYVEYIKASGFVLDAIVRHRVSGLSVAPLDL